MRRNHRSLGKPHGFHVCALRGMRQIDHHPQAIHLGDDFPAQRRQSIVIEVALGFARIRIGQLAVAVVGQRHVSPAPVVELLHSFESVPMGYPFSTPMTAMRRFFLCIASTSAGVSARPMLSGAIFSVKPMNRVELRHRLPVGAVKAFRRQRALADVHDHERDIHVAFDHLRQIDLRRQAHGVVAIRREIRRLDIVMSIELEDPVVNELWLWQSAPRRSIAPGWSWL